jgi:hypothetical protein
MEEHKEVPIKLDMTNVVDMVEEGEEISIELDTMDMVVECEKVPIKLEVAKEEEEPPPNFEVLGRKKFIKRIKA